jgi:ATPase subunit of ABC transporter with duplicated ATPase domains
MCRTGGSYNSRFPYSIKAVENVHQMNFKKFKGEKMNDLKPIELSSRREPSIIFKQNREIGKEILFVEHISKSFDNHKVLNNISFVMNKGDKIALIGPNGIGKTTLCEILVGNLEPDEGKVTWGAKADVGYFPHINGGKYRGTCFSFISFVQLFRRY